MVQTDRRFAPDSPIRSYVRILGLHGWGLTPKHAAHNLVMKLVLKVVRAFSFTKAGRRYARLEKRAEEA